MLLLLILMLIGIYVPLAIRAMREQALESLWVVTTGLLLAVVAGAVLASLWYEVPSISRVVLYMLALFGPIVLVPTLLLSYSKVHGVQPRASLPITLVGAVVGLGCGFVLVVYGLGVW